MNNNRPEDRSGAQLTLANFKTSADLDVYVKAMREFYKISDSTWVGLNSDARIALAVAYDHQLKG